MGRIATMQTSAAPSCGCTTERTQQTRPNSNHFGLTVIHMWVLWGLEERMDPHSFGDGAPWVAG